VKVKLRPLQGTAAVTCSVITGWARNPNYPSSSDSNRKVRIRVYVDPSSGSDLGDPSKGIDAGLASTPGSQTRDGEDFGFVFNQYTPDTPLETNLQKTIVDGDKHSVFVYAFSVAGDGVAPIRLGSATLRCNEYKLSPAVQVSAPYVEDDSSVTFSFNVDMQGGAATSQSTDWCVTGRTVGANVSAATGGESRDEPTDQGNRLSGLCGTTTFNKGTNKLPGTNQVAASSFAKNQKVCRSLWVKPDDGYGRNQYRISQEVCVVHGKAPYVQVLGGDVKVGGSFADDTGACTLADGRGNITASSFEGASSDDNRGSGSEYATFAAGKVSGFGSKAQPGLTGIAYYYLTFANTGVGGYGKYGDTNLCLDDPMTSFGKQQAAVNAPGASPITLGMLGVTAHSEVKVHYNNRRDVHLSLGAIPAGAHIVIMADANIYLDSDITYPASFASTADIPSVYIMTTKNLYIKGDTTRLDGYYSAKGTLVTCSDVTTISDLDTSKCNKQLTINGVVVATDIDFFRTYGAAGDDAQKKSAAEVFNYTPELVFSNALRADNSVIYSLDERDLPARY
jgi:hypothetical protein